MISALGIFEGAFEGVSMRREEAAMRCFLGVSEIENKKQINGK